MNTYRAVLPGSLGFVLRGVGWGAVDAIRGGEMLDLSFRLTVWLS